MLIWPMFGPGSVGGSREPGAVPGSGMRVLAFFRTTAPRTLLEPIRDLAHNSCTLHFLLASEMLCAISRVLDDEPDPSLPEKKGRGNPRHLSPLLAVLSVNLVVFTNWALALNFDLLPVEWMWRNFLLSDQEATRRMYPHTALTHAFSHISLDHLLSNMVTLSIFGPDLAAKFGARKFSYFYVASSYASGFINRKLFAKREPSGWKRFFRLPSFSLGASGAISAVQMCFVLNFPNTKIGISDTSQMIPATLASLIWVTSELLALNEKDGIGHGAHLGGYIFGLAFHVADRLAQIIWKRISSELRKKRWKLKLK